MLVTMFPRPIETFIVFCVALGAVGGCVCRAPADQMAKTAELFGQEDDITVLTMTHSAAIA
jgi:hypothetical protein